MNSDRSTRSVRRGVKRGIKIAIMAVIATFLFGFIIMRLWNWLMPAILGLHAITFWQALGLFLLCKILFGGFHRHGGRGRWGEHMRQRWEQMSPEEREKLRAGMRGRGWCRPGVETRAEQTAQ